MTASEVTAAFVINIIVWTSVISLFLTPLLLAVVFDEPLLYAFSVLTMPSAFMLIGAVRMMIDSWQQKRWSESHDSGKGKRLT